MKLLVASDIHTEFHKDGGDLLLREIAGAPYDVLVCAGDLSDANNLERSIMILLEAAKPRPVVFVLGNHEYYGSSQKEVFKIIYRCKNKSGDQLHWLNSNSTVIQGQRFIGTSLWFPKSLNGNEYMLNDFIQIQGFTDWVYDDHARAIVFLKKEIKATDVVVTHHLPSQQSVSPRFKGSSINHFFVFDLEPLIVKRQPKLWIHGHTHDSKDYMIGGTRIACNPFGYARMEENRDFNSGLIVEI